MARTGSGKRLRAEEMPSWFLRQRPEWLLVGVGLALAGGAMALVAGLDHFVRDLQRGSLSMVSFGYLAMGLTAGVFDVMAAREWSALAFLQDMSRVSRAAREGLRDSLVDHGYVLYLRPFAEDHRLFATDRVRGRGLGPVVGYLLGLTGGLTEVFDLWEVRVLQYFRRLGPVVGVADPGAAYFYPGAHRFRLPDDVPEQEWQPAVSDAIRRARLVILVAGIGGGEGTAAGTLWEYTEAVRLLPPSRVLLLVCGEQEDYDRFRDEARIAFAGRYPKGAPVAPALPGHPPLEHPRRGGRPHPLRGVIRFGPGWKAQFVRFDPTAERGLTPSSRWRATVRQQIEPLLGEVERQLPGDAVIPKEGYRSRILYGIAYGVLYPPLALWLAHSPHLLLGQKVLWLTAPVVYLLGGLYSMTLTARVQRYHKVTVRLTIRVPTANRLSGREG